MTNKRTLGTRLRHLLELLDGDVEQVYRQAGLDYRPRYTPVMRALRDMGPSSITAIAADSGLTHSAVSQTISQMKPKRLVRTVRGLDARVQTVALTTRGKRLLPLLEVHWAATEAAAATLERELSAPLGAVVEQAIEALERRPFRSRIAVHLRRSTPSRAVAGSSRGTP